MVATSLYGDLFQAAGGWETTKSVDMRLGRDCSSTSSKQFGERKRRKVCRYEVVTSLYQGLIVLRPGVREAKKAL